MLPPDTPVPFRPETYAAPQVTYEVKADADGLRAARQDGAAMAGSSEITDIPHGLAAQFGEGGTTASYVHADDNRFVGVEPDEGLHPLIAFLQEERFLYNEGAVPRVTD